MTKIKVNKGCLGVILITIAFWLMVFSFFSCEPKNNVRTWEEGVTECYNWRAGKHFPAGYDYTPPKFKIQGTGFYSWLFEVVFDEGALYQLPDQDSLDWNKLYVVSDDNRRYNKNMVAGAWRSVDGQSIQMAPYANKDFALVLPVERPEPGQQVEIYKYIQPGDTMYVRQTYDIKNQRAHVWIYKNSQVAEAGTYKQFDLPYDPNMFWLASPYFGGTSPAPQDMGVCITATLKLNQGSVEIIEKNLAGAPGGLLL